jgi:hypothetical protein
LVKKEAGMFNPLPSLAITSEEAKGASNMIFDGDKLVDRSSGVNEESYYKNILNNL